MQKTNANGSTCHIGLLCHAVLRVKDKIVGSFVMLCHIVGLFCHVVLHVKDRCDKCQREHLVFDACAPNLIALLRLVVSVPVSLV
jgi:hypothetical protein